MQKFSKTGCASKMGALGVVLALFALASAPARADGETRKAESSKKEASAKSEPVSSDPQITTASFGDWVERCQKLSAGAARVCEVAETIGVEGQSAPIAQVAIGRLEKGDPQRLTLVLPVNVALSSAPIVSIGANQMDLNWRRCVSGGCIADVALGEGDLNMLRAAANPGQIEFKTAAGQELKLAFSFRGLPQSLDALARESVALADTKLR